MSQFTTTLLTITTDCQRRQHALTISTDSVDQARRVFDFSERFRRTADAYSRNQFPEVFIRKRPRMALTSLIPFSKTPKNATVTIESLEHPAEKHKKAEPWRPITLRAPYLLSLLFTTAGLILIIQWLLETSRREYGIIFAEDINKITLRRSFCYLYLPTIISVIYSFLWTWVDLDVKRLEPYFQLSQAGGAGGTDSILLNYPLEFLVTIPISVFKRRHWPVLLASVITILVFWGLTPAQAGIFATRTVTVTEALLGSYSTQYTPITRQGNLTADYAQSVYNISWLNESLPPFMARDYALSAFGPAESLPSRTIAANYTGVTTLYSIDIGCSPARLWNDSGIIHYNSTGGCSFNSPRYRPQGGNDTSKTYDSLYVGYQNQNGNALYDLSSYCNESFFHLFFVRWSNSTTAAIEAADEPGNMNPAQGNETSLFCTPTYYQQKVNATISLPSHDVLEVSPIDVKIPLPVDFFNISAFEWAMSSGEDSFPGRGHFPTSGFPDQKQQLADLLLNLAYIPEMAPFAIATYPRPLEWYLDAEALQLSYQSAYRLLFARQVTDILQRQLEFGNSNLGHRHDTTQAVVVVPSFAYAATALLATIFVVACALLVTILRRPNELNEDPATIDALMNLVSGTSTTAQSFAPLTYRSEGDIIKTLLCKVYLLKGKTNVDSHCGLLTCPPEYSRTTPGSDRCLDISSDEEDVETSKGVRPTEMKMAMGGIFLVLQIAALVAFIAIYCKATSSDGFSLPSPSDFVRQLVENYIPIVFATLVEPFWLVLNRLLGLLQPFEELRKGSATASRSTDIDYSSLPPQVLIVRAFRARHFALGLVCFMVLLANVLAVALSSLIYEGTRQPATPANLSFTKAPQFRSLDGTGLPFNTKAAQNSNGGTTSGQFYYQMSNLTAGTPLPPWTDDQYSYLPVDFTGGNSSDEFQFTTTAFGVELDCQALGKQKYGMNFTDTGVNSYFEAYLEDDVGSLVECTNFQKWTDDMLRDLRDPQPGHLALEIGFMLTNNKSTEHDLFRRQHAVFGWLRMDWKVISGAIGQGGGGLIYYDSRHMNITSQNETMLLCKPNISIGPAEIVVDSTGRIQGQLSANTSSSTIAQYFTTNPQDLVAHANQFLTDMKPTWHTDSFPSDFINYLIKESTNDSSLLDPSKPVPTPEYATKQVFTLYRRLFAILLGTNQDLLLAEPTRSTLTPGYVLKSETRILFSTPAFIVTVAILVLYIFTTIYFYARRPWRILPRLPSTVASNIAFFAASRALAETSAGDIAKDDEIGRKTWRWGYGRFKGTDGKIHIGIEREPFVTKLKKRR